MIGRVVSVVRLLTFVDINDQHDGAPDGSRMSVSARHEAVLADGGSVLLLDDRGWTAEMFRAADGTHGPLAEIWATETMENIERTARFVVGPDEPFEGRTQADMEADHWDYLVRIVQREGFEIEAAKLRALPHDVELSDRVLARLGVIRAGL